MKKDIYSDIATRPLTFFTGYVLREITESCSIQDQLLTVQSSIATAKVKEITTQANRKLAFSQRMKTDSVRDLRVSVIFHLVEGQTGSGDDKIAAAAIRLTDVTGRYKGVAEKPLADESIDINSMLEELKADKCAADVALIPGLGDAITYLTSAEADFITATHDYGHFTSEKGRPLNVIRRELLDLLNDKLLPYINMMGDLDSDNYGLLARRVNDQLLKVNANVLARRTKKPVPFPETGGEDDAEGDGEDITPTDEPNPNPNPGTGTDGSDDDSMPVA